MANKSTGEILKFLRQSNNLSQKEVADALNLSISAISQYETGKRNLSANEIVLFSDYFNVSCDVILGKEELSPTLTLEKKLKLSYEITVRTYGDHTSLFEKFMIFLFYLSGFILLFFPTRKFLFYFALITQFIFIIYIISKRIFDNKSNTKKIFSIPDDVSVYYEYKKSNLDFNQLIPCKNTFIALMVLINFATIIVSVFTFLEHQEYVEYVILMMLLVAFTAAILYEAFVYARKMQVYKKINYFEYDGYLQKTLAGLIEIVSYVLLLLFLYIYLKVGIVKPLPIALGSLLIASQIITHLYHALIKDILHSYDLYAMLNDTLEVKKLN